MHDIEKNIKSVNKSLESKAEHADILELADRLKKFASKNRLAKLEDKVLPKLVLFEESMTEFEMGFVQSKEILRRYDEILVQKANK